MMLQIKVKLSHFSCVASVAPSSLSLVSVEADSAPSRSVLQVLKATATRIRGKSKQKSIHMQEYPIGNL